MKAKSKKRARTTTTVQTNHHEAIAKAILDRLFLSEDIPALVRDEVRESRYIEVSISGIGSLLKAIECGLDHEQSALMSPYFTAARRLAEGIALATAGLRFDAARRSAGAK